MMKFFVYTLLIFSVTVSLCSADGGEGEAEEKQGKIAKTLSGIGNAADKGAAVINRAANGGAAAINKAADKTAAKVDEIRNQEPHEHGEGKLIPSAYQGATRLAGVVGGELSNLAKTFVSTVRTTGGAVRDTIRDSASRLMPKRFRGSKKAADVEE